MCLAGFKRYWNGTSSCREERTNGNGKHKSPRWVQYPQGVDRSRASGWHSRFRSHTIVICCVFFVFIFFFFLYNFFLSLLRFFCCRSCNFFFHETYGSLPVGRQQFLLVTLKSITFMRKRLSWTIALFGWSVFYVLAIAWISTLLFFLSVSSIRNKKK
jgi:hypothetical protein